VPPWFLPNGVTGQPVPWSRPFMTPEFETNKRQNPAAEIAMDFERAAISPRVDRAIRIESFLLGSAKHSSGDLGTVPLLWSLHGEIPSPGHCERSFVKGPFLRILNHAD
jgi:hypothetical protein